jgi:hypothetical protein
VFALDIPSQHSVSPDILPHEYRPAVPVSDTIVFAFERFSHSVQYSGSQLLDTAQAPLTPLPHEDRSAISSPCVLLSNLEVQSLLL